MLMYVGGVVLLRNFPFVGEVRLTVLTRFRERAIRSYRTIDKNYRTTDSPVIIIRHQSSRRKHQRIETRAGINISTQMKSSVWDAMEKNRCFKHPPAAREPMRSMLMYVGGLVLLRNFPFVGEVPQ